MHSPDHEFSSADAYQRLGAIISRVQSRFIRAAPPREVFEPLLTDLLNFTGSEYGFIADLLDDPVDAHQFLRISVLTDISWNDETRAMYDDHMSGRRTMEFHNLKTLFGAAVTSGEAVIANDPIKDPRSGGRPPGHRPMRSFLGVPLRHGGEMVGMVGLSNRPGGYDETLLGFLEPLFANVGAIIGAVRLEAARVEAEQAARAGRAALESAAAAQRVIAAKTEFLSRMSHELRTPLNAVLGFSQLLRMDNAHSLTPKQKTWVGHIENAGTHLLSMINDVLDLSRIEAGTMPLALVTVALDPVVREALGTVAQQAETGRIDLRVEAPRGHHPGSVQVHADRVRLRQVLANLFGNAVKYNRPGGNVVVTWRVSEGGERVEIDVRDTGRGMTAEQLAHLFEPFNRLGVENSRVPGAGIGLVIARSLVHTMGGEIEVDSEAGVGSCFRIVLPAAAKVVAVANSGAPSEPAHLSSLPAPLAVRQTVLFADDNPTNVEVVLAVLRTRPGLRVVVARSGREALELARRERPELMMLDMHLGDMTGLAVMQELSREPGMAHVPFVALAADTTPGIAEDAERAGFRACLSQPLNVRSFLRCIDGLLGHPPAR
jgi:signal transduction histidine kinase